MNDPEVLRELWEHKMPHTAEGVAVNLSMRELQALATEGG